MTLEEVLRMPLGEILARLEMADAPAAEAGERLLTVQQAAARVGCKPDFLYRCRNLSFRVRVGRLVRFKESGLEKHLRLGLPFNSLRKPKR